MKGLGLGPVLYRPSYLQQGQAGGSLWHVHETSRTLQELCRNSSPPEPTGALGKADPTGPGHPAAGHSGLPQGCVGFTHGADELLAELCVLAVGFCWFVCFRALFVTGHLKLCGQLCPEGADYQTARVWDGADLNFDGPLPALKGFNKHVYSTDDDRSLQSIFWTFLCPLPRASKKHILFYCCAVQRAAKEHRA